MIPVRQTQNVSKNVIKSTFWLFGFQGFDKVLGFLRLLILAKLLNPTDFGLMGVAMLTIEIINTFTEAGLITALIQKKGDITRYLNSVWTFLVLRGLGLFVVVYFLAPKIGWFFNTSDAVQIIRVVSVVLVVQGLRNIGIVFFQKNLEFNRQVIWQACIGLVDFVVTLVLAFYLRSAWALVYGMVAGNVGGLVASYILSSYRPKFDFGFGKIRELLQYGRWVFASSILQFLYSSGDDILVGRVLGTVSLGYYQMAYKISNLPTTEITRVISSVMFPTYSLYQDSIEHLRKGYLQVLQVTMFFSILIGGGIWLFIEPFVRLFIGENWMPMVSALKVLVLWGLMRSYGASAGPIFQAIGKPSITTRIQIIQVIVMALIIYPLTIKFGHTGTAMAVVLSAIPPVIISTYYILSLLVIKVNKVALIVTIPTISVLLAMFLMSLINVTSVIVFLLIGLSYCLVYLVLTLVFSRFFDYPVVSMLIKRIRQGLSI